MNDFGKFLVVLGLLIAAAGLLIWLGFGRGWIGRLPGDINYSRPNFSFHFPLTTCLVFSLVLTLLLWLLRK
jgi:membrane protein implicated in regulation of membrane protease activity